MLKSLKNVAATTLVLAATTSYPVRMVAQTLTVPSNSNTPSAILIMEISTGIRQDV